MGIDDGENVGFPDGVKDGNGVGAELGSAVDGTGVGSGDGAKLVAAPAAAKLAVPLVLVLVAHQGRVGAITAMPPPSVGAMTKTRCSSPWAAAMLWCLTFAW